MLTLGKVSSVGASLGEKPMSLFYREPYYSLFEHLWGERHPPLPRIECW